MTTAPIKDVATSKIYVYIYICIYDVLASSKLLPDLLLCVILGVRGSTSHNKRPLRCGQEQIMNFRMRGHLESSKFDISNNFGKPEISGIYLKYDNATEVFYSRGDVEVYVNGTPVMCVEATPNEVMLDLTGTFDLFTQNVMGGFVPKNQTITVLTNQEGMFFINEEGDRIATFVRHGSFTTHIAGCWVNIPEKTEDFMADC